MMVLGALGERRPGVYREEDAWNDEATEGYDIDVEIDGEIDEEEEEEQMSSGKRRHDFDGCEYEIDDEDNRYFHGARSSKATPPASPSEMISTFLHEHDYQASDEESQDGEDSQDDVDSQDDPDIELVHVLPMHSSGTAGFAGGRSAVPGRAPVGGRGVGRGAGLAGGRGAVPGRGRGGDRGDASNAAAAFEDRLFRLADRTFDLVEQQMAEARRDRSRRRRRNR
jgi:hypothetical protein